MNLFRNLPSVTVCLQKIAEQTQNTATSIPVFDYTSIPHELLCKHINTFLDTYRSNIQAGIITDNNELEPAVFFPHLFTHIRNTCSPSFKRVLNATGVVIHTNMGRSLLAEQAIEAIHTACAHYSNLELDTGTGERGSRYTHVEAILCQLTGAESALVVNNNAAAVFLTLNSLCSSDAKKEVIVSRGQLVEIGGSFRIPEVMEKSGAILKEIGTTNRTHYKDYENALTENTAALLKVHTSNYRVIGFHKSVPLKELAELGKQHSLPVIEDLGSGSFVNFTTFGLSGEPTVKDSVLDGADVVTFSGDKVLGGPQAGIIVGKKEYIDIIKKNPLNRALRIDKMTLAGLEATLRLYLDAQKTYTEIPTLAMLAAQPEVLEKRAKRLAIAIRKALADQARTTTVAGMSRVGGGSFPEQDLPTTLVSIMPTISQSLETIRNTMLTPLQPLLPLMVRIENNQILLDVRTLTDKEFPLVTQTLRYAFENK